MKRYLRNIRNWFLDRYYGGSAYDLFLLGLVGFAVLVFICNIIYYA